MLFLTEQDVLAALAGDDAYKEAVDVIARVFEQQSAGSTFHLKRYTMTHPAHPGHLWHNIRILPGMVPELGAAAVRVYSGYRGTNRSGHLLVRLGRHEDVRHHFGFPSSRRAYQRALWRGGQ